VAGSLQTTLTHASGPTGKRPVPLATMSPMPSAPPIPTRIADIPVPQDGVSTATWRWAQRSLPTYLLAHSVRSYCWGATIATAEGWTFDRRILWTAALMHDLGLTRIPRNTMCFEIEGAEIARRFLERAGLPPADADRAAIAIILHMRPSVGLADGVESVLLDRATGIDVRGDGYETIAAVRDEVVRAFPRGAFDRHFLRAIEREASRRQDCQSARLLNRTGLADWMARSPWAASDPRGATSRT
jgi:HD superfamily phosphodiesterase